MKKLILLLLPAVLCAQGSVGPKIILQNEAVPAYQKFFKKCQELSKHKKIKYEFFAHPRIADARIMVVKYRYEDDFTLDFYTDIVAKKVPKFAQDAQVFIIDTQSYVDNKAWTSQGVLNTMVLTFVLSQDKNLRI